MATIGIIANPASGKDVRRLVAQASVFDNQEKRAIVRRTLSGILAAQPEACQIAYLDDAHGIVRGALHDLPAPLTCDQTFAVARTETSSALDSIRAARMLAEIPADIVVTLGGDGTNRAVALGWRQAPLIPVSTGTNNVFPVLSEATIAGAAAGIVARGAVTLDEVARTCKVIEVDIEGEQPDLALIDAVLLDERFIGTRAIWDPLSLKSALLTVADPSAVGITAIGGLLEPLSSNVDQGLHLEFGTSDDKAGDVILAPMAPGYYRDVIVAQHRRVSFSQQLKCHGPGVLAFDGERERVLKPGQQATLTITRSGPRVVDTVATMQLAAERGCFRTRCSPEV